MRGRRWLGAVVVVLAAAPAARAANQEIFAAGDQFVPAAVAAGQGDSLTFVNTDLASHNITSVPAGQFGTKGNVAPGASGGVWGIEKLKPGSYQFVCTLHPGMTGVLYVGSAGAPSAGGIPIPNGGSASGPDPATLLPPVAPARLSPGDWPFYGGDLSNSRNGGSRGPSWNEVATLGPVWSFHSTVGDFTGTPVISRGMLVVGAFNGTVFSLDASTGKLRWSRNLKTTINGSAAIADGRVFVPLAKPGAPAIAALRLRDGRPLWQRRIDSQKDSDVYGSPVVWQRRVYMGISAEYGETSDPKVAARGAVVAVNARTGRVLWRTYTVPPKHDGGAVWTTPAIDPRTGHVYVGTGNAYHAPAASTTDSLLALSARTGRILGHYQATAGDVWNETGNATAGPDADFGASPQLITGSGGRQLIGDGQKSGTYWTFDRRTLRPVWNTTIGPPADFAGGIVGSTAYDGTRIYGPNTPAGEMWALGLGGQVSWLSSDGGPLHFSPVSVANGVVYSVDMSGLLTMRDASTGVVLARVPIGGPSWGGVAIAGGYVFAVTGIEGSSGYVVAYRPRG